MNSKGCLFIARILFIQLFLTLISLPILISWGLPISSMVLISTPIFTPILTLFLFVSTLYFFCELCHFPCSVLITALEYIVLLWQYILSYHDIIPLFGFCCVHWLFLCFIPFFTIFIVIQKKWSIYCKTLLLFIFLVLVGTTLYIVGLYRKNLFQFTCFHGEVTVIKEGSEIIVIDPGYLGARPSGDSWICYELLPYITNMTGKVTIDHFIICHPSIRVMQSIAQATNTITINHVYVPLWKGKIPYYSWRSYKEAIKQCSQQNCIIHSLHSSSKIKTIGKSSFAIQNMSKIYSYKGASYQGLVVSGILNQEKVCKEAKKK